MYWLAGGRAWILTDSWQLCQPIRGKLRFWKYVSTNDMKFLQSCHSVDNIEWQILKSVSSGPRLRRVQTQWCILPRPQLLNTNPDCWILVCRLTNSASLIPPDLLVIRNSVIQVNFNAILHFINNCFWQEGGLALWMNC